MSKNEDLKLEKEIMKPEYEYKNIKKRLEKELKTAKTEKKKRDILDKLEILENGEKFVSGKMSPRDFIIYAENKFDKTSKENQEIIRNFVRIGIAFLGLSCNTEKWKDIVDWKQVK